MGNETFSAVTYEYEPNEHEASIMEAAQASIVSGFISVVVLVVRIVAGLLRVKLLGAKIGNYSIRATLCARFAPRAAGCLVLHNKIVHRFCGVFYALCRN